MNEGPPDTSRRPPPVTFDLPAFALAAATFGGFATAGWCSVTFDVTDWRSIRSPLDAVFG